MSVSRADLRPAGEYLYRAEGITETGMRRRDGVRHASEKISARKSNVSLYNSLLVRGLRTGATLFDIDSKAFETFPALISKQIAYESDRRLKKISPRQRKLIGTCSYLPYTSDSSYGEIPSQNPVDPLFPEIFNDQEQTKKHDRSNLAPGQKMVLVYGLSGNYNGE